jgi:hypothetical protein
MIPRIRLCILNRTGSKAFGARNQRRPSSDARGPAHCGGISLKLPELLCRQILRPRFPGMISWVGHCPLPTSPAGPLFYHLIWAAIERKAANAASYSRSAASRSGVPGSRGIRTVVVCPTASWVLFHLGDRLGNGVSVMAPGGLQISSPNQFGDHFAGSYPEGGLNDLVHGVKVQVTGRLRRCRAIKRRSSAPQRAASLTLV